MELILGRRHELQAVIKRAGEIFNLTGYSARLAIARSLNSLAVLNKPGIISSPELGLIDFIIEANELDVASGHYKVEVNVYKTDDESKIETPISDTIELRSGVIKTPPGAS